MAKGKFYHVYVTLKDGATEEELKTKLNLALDWYKYDKSNWVVYSTSDVEKWMIRLKPLVEPDGRFFICEIAASNSNGWMNKDFWEWMRKTR
jgi:hypothetical protein